MRDWHEVNDVRCTGGNIDVGIGQFTVLTVLKGVSTDRYFFEGPRNEISTLCMSTDSFHNIWLPFCVENSK